MSEFNVGDIVYLNVLPKNREYGYNPGPDGTKCEVVDFARGGTLGVLNPNWPVVKFLEGERKDETASILILHLSKEDPTKEAPEPPDGRVKMTRNGGCVDFFVWEEDANPPGWYFFRRYPMNVPVGKVVKDIANAGVKLADPDFCPNVRLRDVAAGPDPLKP